MIRIDEIYNNTFWPWMKNNRPGYRVLSCDPFGRSDPESVITFSEQNTQEHNYIFFFDQEPIHLNIHTATFDRVKEYTGHISHGYPTSGAICTSEKDSDNVDAVCSKYGWKSYYYFFHGWAALDWYRGYDRTFLIKPPQQRTITKTFLSPNRIIAGERKHRLEMLYWIFKLDMNNNHISCPEVCPAENINIHDAVVPLQSIYPDIEQVFADQTFPMNFNNETGHPMHSCWLSLFDESADSLLYLVTETVATGRRYHLTEKTFKPIALGMPFVIVGTCGSLEYLRSYGFKTFGDIWDESYDNETNDTARVQKVAKLLKNLDTLSVAEKQALFYKALPIIEHNWNHFYGGAFESVLWQELTGMLNGI